MKWTTNNVKKSTYSNNHVIYFGTRAGSFKKLLPVGEDNTFVHRNLHKLDELDKDSRVTALSYDSNMANILIGRAKSLVQVHSLNSEQIKRSVIFDGAPIVGIGYHNNHIIAAIEDGQIQCISYNEGTNEKRVKNFGKSGDNINHMRQCPELSTFVATGGKGRQNNLKVFDLSTNGNIFFSSKNLPNDNLQLEVPIWDSDVGFLNSPYNLVTCSRYGYVRVYDVRAQRRPVHCYNAEDKLSFSTLASRRDIFCVGTTMGIIELFDIRHMKTFIHKYKSFTGGISDIQLDASGKFLFSACLDRYIRVHHIGTTELMYQCYVKSMPTRLLISESDETTNVINSDELDDSKKYKAAHKKNEIAEDKEYEDIFKNLPNICENAQDITENERSNTLGNVNAVGIKRNLRCHNPVNHKKKKK